jgi:hypothetical protein
MEASSLAASVPGQPALPLAPPWIRRLCLLVLAGVIAWFAQVGGLQIALGNPDFEYFYKAGAWLLNHGTLDRGYDVVGGHLQPRGTLDWYWPCVPRLMTLFALLPFQVAGFVWLGANLAAMLSTLRLMGRHLSGLPPQDWPVTQLLPLLLLTPYWLWEFRLNQIDNLTLLLLVGTMVCWQGGRRRLAGFWLGLAVVLKLTPGLLVLWFVLKRQFRTAAAALLTVALAGPVADLIALGPAQTVAAYRAWTDHALTRGSHRGLILMQRETDWRNQGLGAVLSRWLHPTSYNTRFDNDPRIRSDEADLPPRTLNVLSLPLSTVATISTIIVVATLAGLLWLARRPAGQLTLWQLRFEWALFILVMLWLMPVMRRYHMIWALPTLSLLAAGVHYRGRANGWSKFALLCMAVAWVAQITLLYRPLEAAGTILASVVVLAAPLVAMLVRLGRRPAALTAPFFAGPHPARPGAAGDPPTGTAEAVVAHA